MMTGSWLYVSDGTLRRFRLWLSGRAASGDYAMALEPANCGFDGRAGRTRLLAPFEKHINEIRFCIAEGSREIEALEEECRNLMSEQDYGTDGEYHV